MEAVITLPRTACFDKTIEVSNFASRLALRGYKPKTVEGDVLSVTLDGVPYNYDVLFHQSMDWTALKRVKFRRLTDTAKLPTRGSLDAAGLDLYADITDAISIMPGEVVPVSTGIAVQCPSGTYAYVGERSGLGFKGLAVRGRIVDRDYRGEIKVMLQYDNPDRETPFVIQPFDRVGQIIFHTYMDVFAMDAATLAPSVRDGGGFGSTGR